MHRNKNNNCGQQNNRNGPKKKEREVDFHRITQRMRQIDIGKATPEYINYISLIPKAQRASHHPRTPNPREKMPNKWWKKKMNKWRKALHAFDLKEDETNDQTDKDDKKENLVNFCCEKCSKEFVDFDEWQKHRGICKGKEDGEALRDKENMINSVVADFDDDDSSSFDMLRIDDGTDSNEDVDLKRKEITHESVEEDIKKETEESKDELLDALNDVLGDSEDALF